MCATFWPCSQAVGLNETVPAHLYHNARKTYSTSETSLTKTHFSGKHESVLGLSYLFRYISLCAVTSLAIYIYIIYIYRWRYKLTEIAGQRLLHCLVSQLDILFPTMIANRDGASVKKVGMEEHKYIKNNDVSCGRGY